MNTLDFVQIFHAADRLWIQLTMPPDEYLLDLFNAADARIASRHNLQCHLMNTYLILFSCQSPSATCNQIGNIFVDFQ